MKKSTKITIIVSVALLVCIAFSLSIFASFAKHISKSSESFSEVNRHNSPSAEFQGAVETYAASDEYYEDGYFSEAYVEEDYMDLECENGFMDNAPEDTNNLGRMLIRTYTCSLETTDFQSVISSIDDQVKANGGYYESSNITGTGTNNDFRRAYMTIRVPADKLNDIIDELPTYATIISSSESCEDVTLSYADTEARIESLRIEQETLNTLLSEATDLDTIIILQNELTNVRYQIESYESQLRALGNLVEYATLNVTVSEVIEETPIVEIEEIREKTFNEKIKEAFNDAINDIKEDSMQNAINFAGFLPSLIVFLITVLVIGIVITIIVKIIVHSSKKKAAKKAQKEAEEKK